MMSPVLKEGFMSRALIATAIFTLVALASPAFA
jgi:hypothetical protein